MRSGLSPQVARADELGLDRADALLPYSRRAQAELQASLPAMGKSTRGGSLGLVRGVDTGEVDVLLALEALDRVAQLQ